MKLPENRHEWDYRPRFTESDHLLIQAISMKTGIAPNVLIRHIVKSALTEHHEDEAQDYIHLSID